MLGMLFAVAACERPEPRVGGVVVRDSAGLTIVEVTATTEAVFARWQVDSVPEVSIGGSDNPDPLFRIRGVAQLPTGLIAVFDGGSQELRLYDEDGRIVRRVGGPGRGPGRFRGGVLVPTRIYRELLVSDRAQATRLSNDGDILAVRPVPLPIGQAVGRISDREVLTVVAGPALDFSATEGTVLEMHHSFRVFDLETATLDTVVILPAEHVYVGVHGGTRLFESVPFDSRPSAAVGPTDMAFTVGDVPEIAVYDSVGLFHQIIRLAQPIQGFDEAAFDEYVAARLDSIEDQSYRAAATRWYREMPRPERAPVFDQLLFDDQGNLWVRRAGSTGEVPDWLVFDPAGMPLAVVRLPNDLQIAQIGRDFVLGVSVDLDGVEYIRRFRLIRQG